ncbi:MAG: hypothetical protein PVJ50_01350, partial [Desulfobacterales bacterium]
FILTVVNIRGNGKITGILETRNPMRHIGLFRKRRQRKDPLKLTLQRLRKVSGNQRISVITLSRPVKPFTASVAGML